MIQKFNFLYETSMSNLFSSFFLLMKIVAFAIATIYDIFKRKLNWMEGRMSFFWQIFNMPFKIDSSNFCRYNWTKQAFWFSGLTLLPLLWKKNHINGIFNPFGKHSYWLHLVNSLTKCGSKTRKDLWGFIWDSIVASKAPISFSYNKFG